MARKTFTPMFEETETAIQARVVARIPDNWRTEPGDFMHDAVAATPAEVKQLQMNEDQILKNSFAQYASGQWLDERAYEIGMTRHAAAAAQRDITVTAAAGVVIPAGTTVSVVILDNDGAPITYTTDTATTFSVAGTQTVSLTCKVAGVIGNVPDGTQFILQPPLPGITAITDAGLTKLGSETESDDDFYTRYDFRIKHPDTGGNRNDYERWVLEQFEGIVGAAKCVPRWAGNNTVKVVVVGADMRPAETQMLEDVQNYLDPGQTGLGDGKAPCGAIVTVSSASSLSISISADVTYANGYTPSAVASEFTEALQAYLADLVFTGKPVLYNKIGSMLMSTEGVENYSGLVLNGATADILPGAEEVATVGVVTI